MPTIRLMHSTLSTKKGFTLIELIIVIAIIAVIAAGAFVALDPAKRLNSGRNASRWTDVTAVISAIKTFQLDSSTSALPTGILNTTLQQLGTAGAGCNTACAGAAAAPAMGTGTPAAACLNLAAQLAPYLSSIPMDPSTGLATMTRYWIYKDANNLITVGACDAQGEGSGGSGTPPTIRVAR